MNRRGRWLFGLGLPLGCACRLLGGDLPVDPAAGRAIPTFKVPAVKPGVAYERFMVLGDFGTTVPGPKSGELEEYAADQKQVAEAMAMRAKSDGLDLMITVGDNFYENGVKSVDDPMFQSAFVDIYTGPLNVLTYATLGNHDHKGNVQAQIEYTTKNKNWYMPSAYYNFTRTLGDGTKVDFFAVDTTPIKEKKAEVSAQVAWLDEALGKSNARWKFVFGHHPLYCHTARDREKERKTLREAFEGLFVKHSVDVYFAGHDHVLEMLKPVRGVEHVISGGGAGPKKAYGVTWDENESFYAATLGGFVLCRVSRDELVIEFIRLDGKTQFARTVEKK